MITVFRIFIYFPIFPTTITTRPRLIHVRQMRKKPDAVLGPYRRERWSWYSENGIHSAGLAATTANLMETETYKRKSNPR